MVWGDRRDGSTIVAGSNDGAPHAAAERFAPVPAPPRAGEYAHRGSRAEPLELARRRGRSGGRASPAEEARTGRGRPAPAAPAAPATATVARRGGRGRAHDHPPRGRLRGRPRRLLAGALAAGA